MQSVSVNGEIFHMSFAMKTYRRVIDGAKGKVLDFAHVQERLHFGCPLCGDIMASHVTALLSVQAHNVGCMSKVGITAGLNA